MSLEPVAWLCKGARDLPKEVKREIAYYGRHPTASLIDGMLFEYYHVYGPHSKILHVTCPYPNQWLGKGRGVGKHVKSFYICTSIFHPLYSVIPDWAIEELRLAAAG